MLNVKAVLAAFNQEKALVGAFSLIVKTDCETDGSFYSTSQHSGVRPPAAFVTHCSAGTEPLIFTPSYLQLSEIIRWIVTCCGRGPTYVHTLLMKLVSMINIYYLTYYVL